jgi:UDP-glucose 4-epimerase
MNILVTGGAGFIGSHVVDAYQAEGHSVTVVDDFSSGRESNLNPKAELFRCDIRDQERLEKLFSSRKFDVLNHHAAQINVRRSVDDPLFDASVNILGFLNLLQLGVRYGVSRVIMASTGGAIYGEQDVFPADESHPTRPISPYGITKLCSEHYLFYYHSLFGINVVPLRYANVYGPRQNPHGEAGVVAVFATKMLKGEQPTINGDGRQTRDYVYVGDVARANVLALRCTGYQYFNVGTGIETDVNAICEVIRRHAGYKDQPVHGPAKKGEQKRSLLDARKITATLGWKASMSLDDGLALTVDSFRKELGV